MRACQTCGDVAEPMVVVEARAAEELAVCRRVGGADGAEGVDMAAGAHAAAGPDLAEAADPILVDTTLVGAVAPGDELLVHAGVALARAAG